VSAIDPAAVEPDERAEDVAEQTVGGGASPPPGPPAGPPDEADEPSAPVPRRRIRPRRRWWPWWLRSRRVARQAVAMWWASSGADEVRLAWQDSRRAPGWLTVGAIAVLWPVSGFSLMPVGVAVGAWVVLMLATKSIWRWRTRRAVRRLGRRAIGLLAMAVLVWEAGWQCWLIAAGLTDRWRARERLLRWLVARIATQVRADPDQLDFVAADWEGEQLVAAELEFGEAIRAEESAVREKVAQTVLWALRHAGRYRIDWPAGSTRMVITADPLLPELVDEQEFGEVPGIPIGVTDDDTAHGHVDSIDPGSGAVLNSLPIAVFNPADSEKHLLAIGGTGAGKTVWSRGFIARGLRMGFFPGGVFILDGKGSSDYIVLEGREGVHCVARDPDEWLKAMSEIVPLMRSRYDADAEYHRGNQPKPKMPLYLVVIEEIQLIRETLGKEFDDFLQQISRQMRASGGRLLVITQRPDTADSMPGPVRDMLEDRLVLGYVSAEGARMAFGKEWKRVVDEYGEKTVQGRGMARIGGKFMRIQGFYLKSVREDPGAEKYYPPKIGQDAAEDWSRPSPAAMRWAPPRAEAADVTDPARADQAATGGPGVVAEEPSQPARTAAVTDADGPAGGVSERGPRRPRRTV
jgi:hypothetical protein